MADITPFRTLRDEMKVGKDVPRRLEGRCRRDEEPGDAGPWSGYWARMPTVLVVLRIRGTPVKYLNWAIVPVALLEQ